MNTNSEIFRMITTGGKGSPGEGKTNENLPCGAKKHGVINVIKVLRYINVRSFPLVIHSTQILIMTSIQKMNNIISPFPKSNS